MNRSSKSVRISPQTYLWCIFGGIVLFHGWKGADFIGAAYFNDDTFYYLQSAYNLAHLGMLSFDGINYTNGIHFLWTLVLTLWALIFAEKDLFIIAAFLLTAGLLAAATYTLGALAYTRSGFTQPARTSFSLLAMSGLLLLGLGRLPYLLSAMESALLALLLVGFLFAYRRLFVQMRQGALHSRSILLYTALGILIFWTRIDYAIILAAATCFLGLYAALATSNLSCIVRAQFKPLAVAFLIVLGALAIQFGFNYYWNETFLPISGTIKTLAARPLGYQLQMAAFMLFPLDGYATLQRIGAVAFISLTGYSTWQVYRNQTGRHIQLHLLVAVLGWATLCYAFIVSRAMQPYFRWYLVATYIYWVLIIAFWSTRAIEACGRYLTFCASVADTSARLQSWRQEGRQFLPTMPAFIVLGFGALAIPFAIYAPLGTFYPQRIAAARHIDQQFPAGCVFAAWNAGALGYYTHQPLVNLDGLMNSKQYRDTYLYQADKLDEYLQHQGIDYVVDYHFYWAAETVNDYPVVMAWPLGRSGTLQIHRTPYNNCSPDRLLN